MLDERVSEAQSEDETRIYEITTQYQTFIETADAKAKELRSKADRKKHAYYEKCVEEMNAATTISQYEQVQSKFTNLGEYENSAENAMKCQNAINETQEKIQKEKAARAKKIAKKIRIISIITVSVIAISVAFVFVLNKVIIPNQKYNKALSLKEEEKYEEAYLAFKKLDGYKDSDEILQSIKPEYEQIILEKADVGDIVIFGAYEQDGDESNGEEDIEWIVLAKEEGKALVISKYALDCQSYNSKGKEVTWETCSLRQWMNKTFLNRAFSTDEQERILNTNVSADKNPEYETDPGNPTTDKVFLLSITEVEEYFTSDDARACKPTEYAKTNGALQDGEGFCWWWLRSLGSYQTTAAIVYLDESVSCRGSSVNYGSDCVRPALWISLDS